MRERSYKITHIKNNDDDYDYEDNPIESIIDKLNYCRLDYYKLYKKEQKIASVRLRYNLEYIIQTAKQLKRDALNKRKEIDRKKRKAKKEAEEYYKNKRDIND